MLTRKSQWEFPGNAGTQDVSRCNRQGGTRHWNRTEFADATIEYQGQNDILTTPANFALTVELSPTSGE